MGRGILKGLLSGLEEAVGKLVDKRQESNGRKYKIGDAVKSALAVFYFQHPSMLIFQQEMKRKHRRSNLGTLFGVQEIPCGEQIKNIVDEIAPSEMEGAFEKALKIAGEQGILDSYRVPLGGVLIALDGVWYFSSKEIHCEHCLSMEKKGRGGKSETTYYHDMVAAAIVKPDSSVVLPLVPEFIRNEDGSEKQDCERNAAKRWFESQSGKYAGLEATILGDDLYACHAICKQIQGAGMHFLLTCKDESHPWIAEQVKYGEMSRHTRIDWNGRNHIEYRYVWVNRIENRAEGEVLAVNYLYLEQWNEEKQEVTYRNSWITDHEIRRENVEHIAECARTRWKIENEHNNVLKHRGYNLKHNFGHGENHANEIFCMLNLLGFLFHGIQDLVDEDYKRARASFGRRDAFFWALRYETSRYLHQDWHELLVTIAGDAPDG
jgi:hypothetical protein